MASLNLKGHSSVVRSALSRGALGIGVVDRVLGDFVEKIHKSHDTEAMRNAVADAIVALDLRTFTYFSPAGGPRKTNIFISTYPTSWTDHYFAHKYDCIDPVFTIAYETGKPFRWGKDVPTLDFARSQKQMFDEAAAFGIRNGLTLPLGCGTASFAALTIVADEKPVAFKRKLNKAQTTLKFIAIAFHAEVRRKRWLTGLVDGVALTPREIECLEWSVQGKSKEDIASILGIRRSTIVFHLENAKRKLGVRTVPQAVARFASSD